MHLHCRWEVVPLGAFPGWLTWADGGGDIWCPDSHYCPDPTTKLVRSWRICS